MSENGICSKCRRPILSCVAYPATLCNANNEHFCMACAKEKMNEFTERKIMEMFGNTRNPGKSGME